MEMSAHFLADCLVVAGPLDTEDGVVETRVGSTLSRQDDLFVAQPSILETYPAEYAESSFVRDLALFSYTEYSPIHELDSDGGTERHYRRSSHLISSLSFAGTASPAMGSVSSMKRSGKSSAKERRRRTVRTVPPANFFHFVLSDEHKTEYYAYCLEYFVARKCRRRRSIPSNTINDPSSVTQSSSRISSSSDTGDGSSSGFERSESETSLDECDIIAESDSSLSLGSDMELASKPIDVNMLSPDFDTSVPPDSNQTDEEFIGFVPYCLVAISKSALYSFFRNLMRTLYTSFIAPDIAESNLMIDSNQHDAQVPNPILSSQRLIGRTIEHLVSFLTDQCLYGTHLPCVDVSIDIPDMETRFVLPCDSGITLFKDNEIPLEPLFEAIELGVIIRLLNALILEKPVLVISKHRGLLPVVLDGLRSLMYPFQWMHTYIPLLPPSLHDFLDAPVPFLVGLCSSFDIERDLVERIVENSEDLVVFDMDGSFLRLAGEVVLFPEKEIRGLRRDLGTIMQSSLKRFDVVEAELNDDVFFSRSLKNMHQQHQVRLAFLMFWSNLVCGFDGFIERSSSRLEGDIYLDSIDSESERAFYSMFLATNALDSFVQRYCEEDFSLLFFNLVYRKMIDEIMLFADPRFSEQLDGYASKSESRSLTISQLNDSFFIAPQVRPRHHAAYISLQRLQRLQDFDIIEDLFHGSPRTCLSFSVDDTALFVTSNTTVSLNESNDTDSTVNGDEVLPLPFRSESIHLPAFRPLLELLTTFIRDESLTSPHSRSSLYLLRASVYKRMKMPLKELEDIACFLTLNRETRVLKSNQSRALINDVVSRLSTDDLDFAKDLDPEIALCIEECGDRLKTQASSEWQVVDRDEFSAIPVTGRSVDVVRYSLRDVCSIQELYTTLSSLDPQEILSVENFLSVVLEHGLVFTMASARRLFTALYPVKRAERRSRLLATEQSYAVAHGVRPPEQDGVPVSVVLRFLRKVQKLKRNYQTYGERFAPKNGEFIVFVSPLTSNSAGVMGRLVVTNRRVLFGFSSFKEIGSFGDLTQVYKYNLIYAIPPGLPCIKLFGRRGDLSPSVGGVSFVVWSDRDPLLETVNELIIAYQIVLDVSSKSPDMSIETLEESEFVDGTNTFIDEAAICILLMQAVRLMPNSCSKTSLLQFNEGIQEASTEYQKLSQSKALNLSAASVSLHPNDEIDDLVEFSSRHLLNVLRVFHQSGIDLTGNVPPSDALLEKIRRSEMFNDIERDASKLRSISSHSLLELKALNVEGYFSFMVNLYNSMALHGLITNGFPSRRSSRRVYFQNTRYAISDYLLCLDDIEHGILRGDRNRPHHFGTTYYSSRDKNRELSMSPEAVDARLHFCLACGTISSPMIRVFRSSKSVNVVLNEAATDFCKNHIRIDSENDMIHLPGICDWYGRDFGSNVADIVSVLLPFLDVSSRIAAQGILDRYANVKSRVKFDVYSWDQHIAVHPNTLRQVMSINPSGFDFEVDDTPSSSSPAMFLGPDQCVHIRTSTSRKRGNSGIQVVSPFALASVPGKLDELPNQSLRLSRRLDDISLSFPELSKEIAEDKSSDDDDSDE